MASNTFHLSLFACGKTLCSKSISQVNFAVTQYALTSGFVGYAVGVGVGFCVGRKLGVGKGVGSDVGEGLGIAVVGDTERDGLNVNVVGTCDIDGDDDANDNECLVWHHEIAMLPCQNSFETSAAVPFLSRHMR